MMILIFLLCKVLSQSTPSRATSRSTGCAYQQAQIALETRATRACARHAQADTSSTTGRATSSEGPQAPTFALTVLALLALSVALAGRSSSRTLVRAHLPPPALRATAWTGPSSASAAG